MELNQTGAYQSMDDREPEETEADDSHPVLVIGRRGSGKSSLCNALLGRDEFSVGNDSSPPTKTAECANTWLQGLNLKIVDTPDITSLDLNAEQMKQEVDKWQEMTQPGPDVVILTVRGDVRYTADDWAMYKEISGLWGEGPLGRLLVVFTFGDTHAASVEEELKTDCPELHSVLTDAQWNYLLFDKTDEKSAREAASKVCEVIKGEYRHVTGHVTQTSSSPPRRPSVPILVCVALAVLAAAGCIASLLSQHLAAAVGCAVLVLVLVAAILALWLVGRSREKEERLLPK